jgi:hypothetical protein
MIIGMSKYQSNDERPYKIKKLMAAKNQKLTDTDKPPILNDIILQR